MVLSVKDIHAPDIVSRGTIASRSKRDPRPYVDIVTAFDIETTKINELNESIMYIWQWHFDGIGTVVGRTWTEFWELKDKLVHELEYQDCRLVVWVHNLSYEFQFLSGIYPFTADEVFCLKSRQILTCTMDNGLIEFRCSYKQTNMSLGAFLKKTGVPDQKLTMDYSVKRYPWTPLTDDEIAYCIHDVTGLVQAMKKRMEASGDTVATVPRTSTGYVRRDARRSLFWWSKNHRNLFPNLDQYQMLREAFRGGNTHANRYITGEKLHNVFSFDRSSSYPDVLVNCQFPVSPFVKIFSTDIKKIDKRIERGLAVVIEVKLENVKLKDRYWPVPYLSVSKCRNASKVVKDNGRVISAESLETTITDIDLKIIRDEYECDITVLDGYMSRYDYLPDAFRDLIKKYYQEKTDLKTGDQYQYFLRKCLLNSLYGMTAQDPGKEEIIFEENNYLLNPEFNLMEKIIDYDEKGFLPYQWGCWCTAWARLRLEEGIRLVHDQGGIVCYCDTDSVKYTGDNISWDAYNAERKADSEQSGAFADDAEGHRHYMGVYEQEHTYANFKTLGAKKYVYDYGDGKTYITVAGVIKSVGGEELDKAGGIDAFKTGFIFSDAGGLEAVYNTHEPYEYEIDGHTVVISNNICLNPSTYTVGLSKDYKELLEYIKEKISGGA